MSEFKVLLVEDSATSAKIIRSFLRAGQSDAYDVTGAVRLSDALDCLANTVFDVIVLDLMLPDSSDMETVKAVRSAARDTAIIVMTGGGDTNTAMSALRHGCQEYLVKGTFDGNLLRHAIRYAVERNRMEVLLRENERRFQDYAGAGADWFWEMSPDLTITFLSDGFEEITEIKKEEVLGKPLTMVGDIEHRDTRWMEFLKDTRRHRPFRNFDFPLPGPGGDSLWVRLNGRPIFDKSGKFLGYRGTGTDITLEKHADFEFKRNKATVDGILSTSLDGFLVLKAIRTSLGKVADFVFQHVNRRAEELLGRSRNELLGKLFKREMDHMVAQGVFKRAGQTVATGAAFDIEQFYNDKGIRGWIRIVGVRLDGDRLVITLSDISARKEAEREQRLAEAVFRTSAEGMLVTDANNRIVAANPTFTEITGYAIDEVINRDPKILSSGRHPKTFYEEFWRSLERDGHWFGELWNRRKDGEIFVQRATISLIKNEMGVVQNYVCVFNDTTEQKERELKLYHGANYDALTGLPNRALLDDRIAHAIPKVSREEGDLGVLFIDLDGFKPVNDTHGHLVGDQVLQEVAKRFSDCVRESDTVARLGGDEFVVLALDVKGREGVETVAKHILASLDAPITVEETSVQVGASIGISLYPTDGDKSGLLVDKADKAMYEAKKAGKNTYRLFS